MKNTETGGLRNRRAIKTTANSHSWNGRHGLSSLRYDQRLEISSNF